MNQHLPYTLLKMIFVLCVSILAVAGMFTFTGIVSADPGLIGDDERLSDVGGLGNTNHRASDSAVAYNATNDIYLVVWRGDETQNEREIYGQLISGATGTEIGTNDFLVMAGVNTNQILEDPAVVWNSTHNEFLVVAHGDVVLNGRNEIHGQRLNGMTGALVGNTRFQITDSGGGAGTNFNANNPDVTYNATSDEYFVVWDKDKNTTGATEIWGRRIYGDRGTGDTIGSDIRISDMGTIDTATNRRAGNPKIAWNSVSNEYLVVWNGTDDDIDQWESEIYGQRLNGSGSEIGANDFRISSMGTDGNSLYIAASPDVAYNRTHNEYLVVWVGNPGTAPLNQFKNEIWGQRLNNTGVAVGNDDFRISDSGPDGVGSFFPADPTVAYGNYYDQYVVFWRGDDDIAPLVNGEYEVLLQRIAGDRTKGDEVGQNDVRVSHAGPDGNTGYFINSPAVAVGSPQDRLFVTWHGGSDQDGMVLNESEVFAHVYHPPLTEKCGVQTATPYVFSTVTHPVTITVNTIGDIDCIAVTAVNGNHPTATTNIQTGRYWTITAVDSADDPVTSGFDVTLTLPYASASGSTRACKYPGGLGGFGWDCGPLDGTGTTFESGVSVTRTGINGFSDWAVGSNVGPTAVTLQDAGQQPTGLTLPLLVLVLGLMTLGVLYARKLLG